MKLYTIVLVTMTATLAVMASPPSQEACREIMIDFLSTDGVLLIALICLLRQLIRNRQLNELLRLLYSRKESHRLRLVKYQSEKAA